MRILYLEDEVDLQLPIVELIKGLGSDIIVDVVGDGDEAQRMMKNNFYHLAIFDICTPGAICGVGLLKWMVENKTRIPVIVTSGKVTTMNDLDPDNKNDFLSFVTVIAKPFDMTYLKNLVKSFLYNGLGAAIRNADK